MSTLFGSLDIDTECKILQSHPILGVILSTKKSESGKPKSLVFAYPQILTEEKYDTIFSDFKLFQIFAVYVYSYT